MPAAVATVVSVPSMNEWLMRAVVQAAAFFELVSDDTLDPDVAVKELESITFLLNHLRPEEKQELVAFVQREAESARLPDYREFLLAFPEATGLLEQDD